jgi:hypothetical protein
LIQSANILMKEGLPGLTLHLNEGENEGRKATKAGNGALARVAGDVRRPGPRWWADFGGSCTTHVSLMTGPDRGACKLVSPGDDEEAALRGLTDIEADAVSRWTMLHPRHVDLLHFETLCGRCCIRTGPMRRIDVPRLEPHFEPRAPLFVPLAEANLFGTGAGKRCGDRGAVSGGARGAESGGATPRCIRTASIRSPPRHRMQRVEMFYPGRIFGVY